MLVVSSVVVSSVVVSSVVVSSVVVTETGEAAARRGIWDEAVPLEDS